jgi:AcrR family transcriptional regulator
MQHEIDQTDRRQRVVNAAWEVFARFGYQKASMQDIAISAGVSKSVLFKYFGTKEFLYRAVFCEAARAIAEADAEAKEASAQGESVFSRMRKTVESRMRLFARAPYVYAFSYAAAYDTAQLPQTLVREALLRAEAGGADESAYEEIRADICPAQAKQMIFWVSQGFLGDKLARGTENPETLKQEFSEWIDLMERLMTQPGRKTNED